MFTTNLPQGKSRHGPLGHQRRALPIRGITWNTFQQVERIFCRRDFSPLGKSLIFDRPVFARPRMRFGSYPLWASRLHGPKGRFEGYRLGGRDLRKLVGYVNLPTRRSGRVDAG